MANTRVNRGDCVRREILTLADREEISRRLAAHMQQKDIAAVIGRNPSVVSREIARHGGRRAYRAHHAATAAREARGRPKCRKNGADARPKKRAIRRPRKNPETHAV